MASRLYDRLRQLAIREWKIAPPLFDQMQEEGRILMSDMTELVTMLMHEPLFQLWLKDYLWPLRVQREEAQKRTQEAVDAEHRRIEQNHRTMLMMLNMCKPENETDAEHIAAMKEALAK